MDRWPINPRRVIIFVGILVLVLMVMDFNARLEDLKHLQKQAGVVSIQVTQSIQTQAALQTQVAFSGSDQAVQEWARSEGHLIQPGDQPVVPISQPGSTPIQSVEPTSIPTPKPNWQVWWNLFFGDQ
jgi:cell division protein FtsB